MLIKALCEYADFLAENGQEKLPEGWCYQGVSFRIMLSPEGDVTNIIDLREEKTIPQKKGNVKIQRVPIKLLLPKRTDKTAIDSNTIEHRPLYIFGLSLGKNGLEVDNKAKKSHDAFVAHEKAFFAGLDSEICLAYQRFLDKWQPEQETENSFLQALGKTYSQYFSFGLSGGVITLEDDPQFRKRYDDFVSQKIAEQSQQNTDLTQCSITGEMAAAARIHDKIKFPGGNSTGCVLVGMKESAFESYGKTQSYNSGISEIAMKKYTSTLNGLLADRRHRIILEDLVLVFFAMKQDDTAECDEFAWMLGETSQQQAAQVESGIYDVMKDAPGGKVGDAEAVLQKSYDDNVLFYIAGMTANASRICQKFIYRGKFGDIVKNLKKHQRDLHICDNKRSVYFSAIRKQIVQPNAKEARVPKPLMVSILMAALNGGKYPQGLLETVIRRVKTDSDKDGNHYIKCNDIRAGIIKACLNRKYNQEVITVALNEQNHDPAYLCGRLFAVLEKIQQESVTGALNRTITDAYFASAAGKPSVIFPKLMQLSANHRRKLPEGRSIYFDKLTGEIISHLDGGFPQTLNLDGQGKFIVGYYQQKKELYTKKTEDGKEE